MPPQRLRRVAVAIGRQRQKHVLSLNELRPIAPGLDLELPRDGRADLPRDEESRAVVTAQATH